MTNAIEWAFGPFAAFHLIWLPARAIAPRR
jgi:hypothetical protein